MCHGSLVNWVDQVANNEFFFPLRNVTLARNLLVSSNITASHQTNVFHKKLYQTLKITKMAFEKLPGLQVFKNRNCSSFPSFFSIRAFFCICCYLYLFVMFLAVTFILHAALTVWSLLISWHSPFQVSHKDALNCLLIGMHLSKLREIENSQGKFVHSQAE